MGVSRDALERIKSLVQDASKIDSHTISSVVVECDKGLSLPAAEPMTEHSDHVDMSPEFTDTARAALLWVLWHHQVGSSPVGQPIRYALGMGANEHLNAHQVNEAKRWASIAGSHTSDFRAHHGIGKGE